GEPKWAQRPVISEDDSMLQRRAPNEPSGPEGLRLAEEPEGAGARQLGVVLWTARPALRADRRVRELDGDVEALVARLHPGQGGAERDLHGRRGDEGRRRFRRLAERRDGLEPRRRRAVEYRQLLGAGLDDDAGVEPA